MNMKKRTRLTLVCLLLVGAFLLAGCNAGDAAKDGSAEQAAQSVRSTENESETEAKVVLDAFANLKVSFEGISPRCGVVLDASECSEQVRSSVTYQADKQFYANQETVTITAILSQQAKRSFALKEETMTYEVTNMPAYYDMDSMAVTELIEEELKDVVNAQIAQMGSTNKLFGIGGQSSDWYYSKVESVTSLKGYLLTIKETKADAYGSQNAKFYNSIRIVTDCYVHTDGTGDNRRQGHIYVCFILDDVVVAPDGKISWKNGTYDISYIANANDNNVADTAIHNMSVYYEIEELAKTDWLALSYTD